MNASEIRRENFEVHMVIQLVAAYSDSNSKCMVAIELADDLLFH